MPLMTVTMRPGINSQLPLLANEGGWSASQLMRFKNGCPQSIGGWVKWWSGQFDTPIRTILSWGDLNGNAWTALGSDTSCYIIGGNNLLNITPLTATTNPVPDFSTTAGSSTVAVVDSSIGQLSGSAVNVVVPVAVGGIVLSGIYNIVAFQGPEAFTIDAASAATSTATGGAVPSFATTASSEVVTVTLADHGYAVGETFGVDVSTPVGGITLEGSYLVQSVISSSQFTITAASAATSTATASENGGNTRLVYYGGTGGNGTNYAYGVGGYGNGGYGQGSIYTPGALPDVPLWTFANWGETLLLCAGNGSLYSWTPSTGETQAQLIPNAPTINNGIFIAQPELVAVTWGASVNGVQEPLLVAWSQVGDYTQWAPTVTNQAGSQTIPSGSKVVAGLQGPQQALIFTDVDVYSMNYLGGVGESSLGFGFIKLADHCGLIGPRAACVLGDSVFWMSAPPANAPASSLPSGGQFMVFTGGGVSPIPCTVWDKVFQDLDWDNAHKIVAAPNALFHEVGWYYPSLSGGTGECDRYVKFNVLDQVWDYGSLGRTGWQDMSPVGNPLGGGSDSYVYQHEIGILADGQPMNWSISSGGIMINQGSQIGFCDWVLPEFQWGFQNEAQTDQPVTMTVNGYRFTTDAAPATTTTVGFSASGPGFSYLRVRGRHMTVSYTGVGFARIGDVRLRVAPDGVY